MDSIKTSCRSLIRIGNGEAGRVPLSYWLGSCAVPLFVQLYPERDARQTPLHRQRCLEKLALHMQVKHWLSACHVCRADHCFLAFHLYSWDLRAQLCISARQGTCRSVHHASYVEPNILSAMCLCCRCMPFVGNNNHHAHHTYDHKPWSSGQCGHG